MRLHEFHFIETMKILAIETSCDETALALIEASGGVRNLKFKVLENLVSSQVKIHRQFGGVVPNLAKREHLRNLPILFKKITKNYQLSTINLIAVTVGPGLEPALWTGVNFAKEIYKQLQASIKGGSTSNEKNYKLKTKLVGGNHLEGHLYSFLLSQKRAKPKSKFLISKLFPAVALIVSGGHTILLKMDSLTRYKKIGETRDDAVGEAFDKVARLLGLPYPGGPEIEKLAKKGNGNSIEFPRPMLTHKNYDFSFAGLKTSVLYFLRDNSLPTGRQAKIKKADVAASFQKAAIDVLIQKTMRAAKEFQVRTIILGGGVAANKELQDALKKEVKKLGLEFLVPQKEFNTDNAAMVAVSSYINYLKGRKYRITAQANINM